MEMREEKLYSTGKAAKLLGAHFNTMKKRIYAGRVKTIKTLCGQYRVPESEIRRLLGQPAPKKSGSDLCEGVVSGSRRRPEAPAKDAAGVRK